MKRLARDSSSTASESAAPAVDRPVGFTMRMTLPFLQRLW
jgi:hypothetical protein